MDASTMRLQADEDEFRARWRAIDDIEASGRVTSYDDAGVDGLLPLLTGNGRTGSRGLCHATNLNTAYNIDGFCWDKADDTSLEWTPQGITGSHDASPTGLWHGKYVYIASWHFTGDRFARICVVDNTPGSPTTYNRVLLVDADGEGGNANFRAVGDPNTPAGPCQVAMRTAWPGMATSGSSPLATRSRCMTFGACGG
jgi:hypothetical protein